MRFLIAPNAFKGTLTSTEAAELMQAVLLEELPLSTCFLQPLADGGDGTCQLLISALGLEKKSCWSLNAVGQPCLGFYGWEEHSQTAYLDVSTCSGIGRLTEYQKNPTVTSSFGTGLLIRQAIAKGAKHLVLGLGGSASIDLGAGILQALGFLFLDEKGRELSSFSPNLLERCKHIQRPLVLPNLTITCLCDVRNSFFGEGGALRIFGPQKGVLPQEIPHMEVMLQHFFDLLCKKSKNQITDSPGFGAAGGIAYGLSFFFTVQLVAGAQYFFELVNLDKQIAEVDWVITGEGKFDSQSKAGKATHELLQLARRSQRKIALISTGKEGLNVGFDAIVELPHIYSLESLDKNKAQEDLQGLLSGAIRSGIFSS